MLDVFEKDYIKNVKIFNEEEQKFNKNAKRMSKDDDQQNTQRLRSLEADLIHVENYKKQTNNPVRKQCLNKQVHARKCQMAQVRAGSA